MAGQEQVRPQRRDDGGADDAPEPAAAAPQVQASEIDDILDEIDGVLESNAEEFVRGFVQKGGQ
jgi:ubiquitin-like protein Pup